VRGGAEQRAGRSSTVNRAEVRFVKNLHDSLFNAYPALRASLSADVGVITFYAAQKNALRTLFRRDGDEAEGGAEDGAGRALPLPPREREQRLLRRRAQRERGAHSRAVEINTVDGFQGREKAVIILSTVRASGAGGVGFVRDVRRMNVALSRARISLWVVCHEATMRREPHWEAFCDYVREYGAAFDIDDVDAPLVAPPPLVDPSPLAPPLAPRASPAPIPYDIEAVVNDAGVDHRVGGSACDGDSVSASESASESESDGGGVEVLESVPLVEVIARDIAAAEQRGDVIDLTADDVEDGEIFE
jgi:hypothetical protein